MERLLTIDRAISHHRVKANPVESPPSTLTFAYQNRRYEKMYKQLSSDDDILRRKVLIQLNEDFHFGDKIVQALNGTPIIKELMRGLIDKNDEIRQLSSFNVLLLGKSELGKATLVQNGYITNVSNLLDDGIVEIRRNGYHCLLQVVQYREGIDNVITYGIIQVLVDKLIIQKNQKILLLTLTLMNQLLDAEQGPRVALKTKIIIRLNDLLKSSNKYIVEKSATILGSLSFDEQGKQSIVKSGTIDLLCPLLSNEDSPVRQASSRCLASLGQLKQGKLQIYGNQVLDKVMELLNDSDEQTRLNIVQIIAAVAEYPPGRETFKQCRDKLKELISLKDDFALVSEFAQIALDVIDWIP